MVTSPEARHGGTVCISRTWEVKITWKSVSAWAQNKLQISLGLSEILPQNTMYEWIEKNHIFE